MAESNSSLSTKLAARGAEIKPLGLKGELLEWKNKNLPALQSLWGSKDAVEKLYIAVCYALSQNLELVKCSKESITNCMMQSSYTGLYPGALQECDYVPYKGKATFIPRYGGLVKLATNTGLYGGFSANVVYEKDEFEYEEGTSPVLRHRKFLGAHIHRGERVCVYAVCKDKSSGEPIFVVLPIDEVEDIKRRSRASGSSFSPWNNDSEFDYDEMCKKTALKRLCKLLSKTPQLARAVDADNKAERTDLAKPTVPGFEAAPDNGGDDESLAGESSGGDVVEQPTTDGGLNNPPQGVREDKKSHYLQDREDFQASTIAKPKDENKKDFDRIKERAKKEEEAFTKQ